MIVIGVDPGSHATGYGIISSGNPSRMIAGGVIRPPKAAGLPERLHAIHSGIAGLIAEHRPDEMAVENVFNAKNVRSSLILGHARGVILLAGAEAGLPVGEYAPREVKKALTGNGAARKEQVRFMVIRLLGLTEQPPLDQSDALAIALAHATRPTASRLGGTPRKGRG